MQERRTSSGGMWGGVERRRAGFRCPNPACGAHDADVIRVRPNADGTVIHRRHECQQCRTRFSSTATICATGSVGKAS